MKSKHLFIWKRCMQRVTIIFSIIYWTAIFICTHQLTLMIMITDYGQFYSNKEMGFSDATQPFNHSYRFVYLNLFIIQRSTFVNQNTDLLKPVELGNKIEIKFKKIVSTKEPRNAHTY